MWQRTVNGNTYHKQSLSVFLYKSSFLAHSFQLYPCALCIPEQLHFIVFRMIGMWGPSCPSQADLSHKVRIITNKIARSLCATYSRIAILQVTPGDLPLLTTFLQMTKISSPRKKWLFWGMNAMVFLPCWGPFSPQTLPFTGSTSKISQYFPIQG